MSVSFDEAVAGVRLILPAWRKDAVLPDAQEKYLCECLCALMDGSEGKEWLEKRPYLLKDADPVYHCAGFRPNDVHEYLSVVFVKYQGIQAYFRPEDAETLLRRLVP